MNIIPNLYQFYKDYLLLTDGKCPRNRSSISICFKRSTSQLTSDKEFMIIDFLCNNLNAIQKCSNLKKYKFHNEDDLISFLIGIVHYYPKLFLNQMDKPIYKQRYRTVLLLKSLISLLVSKNCSINLNFLTKTKYSSEYCLLVLTSFLSCFNDQQVSIRQLFLQVAQVLLSCSSAVIDGSKITEICSKVCKLLYSDTNISIRKFALTIIEEIFVYKPANVFNDETFNVLLHACFDKMTPFRLYSHRKLANIYINLMKQFSRDIYYLPQIGRLAGALRLRFSKTQDRKEKQLLFNYLKYIDEFLFSIKSSSQVNETRFE